MPPHAAGPSSSVLKGAWRPTKIMNMRDLSHDDDFLSHLLVEKLGTGGFPLVVHKMDPSKRLPKTNPEDLMQIIRRLVAFKGPSQTAIRQAVDDLLTLNAVRYYIQPYTQKQTNAFATHASRYFELYLPSGSIEIAHTSRYSHRTGKSELCILATRPLVPGQVISELKGSMADLTDEEDKELKGTDIGRAEGVGIRRDFSVIHSKQLKKNHLFLGPARFVNHDCDHNVELFREGRYITFRVIKPIGVGEEVTAHYGDGYFGRNNRHCLCHTCELNKRGGYAAHSDELSDSGSSPGDSSSDNDESDWTTDREDAQPAVAVNINERRTRRGVYAVLKKESAGSDAEVDGDADRDVVSEVPVVPPNGLLTPHTETPPAESRPVSAASTPRKATPPKTFIISTRAQKARAASELESISAAGKGKTRTTTSRSASGARQLETPPLTSDNGSVAEGPSRRSSTRLRARGDTAAPSGSRVQTPVPDRKGKTPASGCQSTVDVADIKGKGREDPDMEGRSLRKRPTIPSLVEAAAVAAAKKPQDGPRGVDGKLLPTCTTCKNVLPVISVEDKVVWNGAPEKTGKRGRPKKQVNQECPRCMRHYAIYAVRWPERAPLDGTPAFIPTPESSGAPLPLILPTRSEEPATPAPPKRQKVAPAPPRPRGRPPKNKVGMSNKARELLGVSERRSERTRVPSLKLRESEPPSKPSPAKAPASTSSSASEPERVAPSSSSLTPPNSDVGNRHLRSSGLNPPPEPPSTPVVVKTEELPKLPTPKSLAVASQPRETNGRFGKKESTNGRYMRKNFHFTAGGRRLVRSKRLRQLMQHHLPSDDAEDGEELPSISAKRVLDDAEDLDDEDRGKRRKTEDDDVKVKIEGEEASLSAGPNDNDEDGGSADEAESRLFRRPTMMPSKKRFGLNLGPNPHTYARRKWVLSVSSGDQEDVPEATTSSSVQHSTDEDLEAPVTPGDDEDALQEDKSPEDNPDLDDDVNESDSESEQVYCRPKMSLKSGFAGAHTYKPSPFNMARRRWAPPVPTPGAGSKLSSKVTADELAGADADPGASSEEEGFRGPSIMSIYKPGRRSSSSSSALVDLSDNSEKMLAGSLPPAAPASPQRSPSMGWKQTVLLPVNVPFLHAAAAVTVTADISPAPSKLIRNGWENSDETD
ncbi:uncharacterized protein BXZ73DRAFT_97665 [Epithele typhae]|uniref:uncharacterized protein n=1 Tax=Epithele typhae TaxID=378194 RepID=UPI0020083E6B|nr:uncharacterized protein BXZ73DRAFT_97665 [Epithele typhae]KAH9942247.1 hypothetical protein BXZ73DRAFT_97665 [Epithele typhae]